MRLPELTKELFDYLVAFRQKVEQNAASSFEQVRKELEDIFTHMEEETRRQPELRGPYQKVKYPLIVLSDEILLSSKWEHVGAWEMELLEQKYFGTNIAGNRFFELIEKAEEFSSEVATIFYYCLVLGFGQYYIGDEFKLAHFKSRLLARISGGEEWTDELISADAYVSVEEGSRQLRRLWRWQYTLLIGLGVVVFFFILDRWVVWPMMTLQASTVTQKADAALAVKSIHAACEPVDMVKEDIDTTDDAGTNENDIDTQPVEQAVSNISVEEEPEPPAMNDGDGFVIRLTGMFKKHTIAMKRYNKLYKNGHEPFLVKRARRSGNRYLIFVGTFSSRAKAIEAKKKLTFKGTIVSRSSAFGECIEGCDLNQDQ